LLVLLDYPTIEDCEYGTVCSGINRRSRRIHSFLHDAGIPDDAVSFASVMQCITRSKALDIGIYDHCGQSVITRLRDSAHDITTVLAFGSIPARLMLGVQVSRIDDLRGQVHPSVVPGISCIVTYALSVFDEGCSSCRSNVFTFLAKKDIALAWRNI